MFPSYQTVPLANVPTKANAPKEERSSTPVPRRKKVAVAAAMMVGMALVVVGYSYGASTTHPARMIDIATTTMTTTATAANLVRGGVQKSSYEQEGCYDGPCNKQLNERACLSGTFAAGCNWYPHWGAGGCSSCSGVSCGNHRAVECGYCNLYGPDPRKPFKTNDKGKNYCNGDCWWGRQKFGVGLVLPRCWPK